MKELIRKIGAHRGALPMSWSRVNLLLTCPRQFDLRYRQKVKEIAPPCDPSAAEAGKLMHQVLELAMFRCGNLGAYTYETSGYEGLFDRIITQAASQETRERLLSLREPSARVLARMIGMAGRFGATTLVEKRLAMDRAWDPMEKNFSWQTAAWAGFVDLIMLAGDKAIIADYKSEPWSEDKANSTEMQTLLYAYALMRLFPQAHSVQTVTAFLPDECISPSGMYRRENMPEMEERITNLFTEYLALLESGDAAPRASKLCQWCGYSANCPLEDRWQGKRKEAPV